MDEHRALPRLTPRPPAVCLLSGGDLPSPVPVVLVDVSARGAGLCLAEPLRPGDWLRLLPPDGGAAAALRVAHCRRAPRGGYLAGGAFSPPLTDAELRGLLGEAPDDSARG